MNLLLSTFSLAGLLVICSLGCAAAESADSFTAVGEADTMQSIGVVTLGNYEKGDSLEFFNRDGTLWLRFDPYYRENEEVFELPEGFKPLAIHPDYFTLVMQAKEKTEAGYAVVVNEATGATKYVQVTDSVLTFKTWEELFKEDVSSVSIVLENQKLREKGRASADEVGTENAPHYFNPVAVNGNWLKVEWPIHESGTQRTGWVQWRNDRGEILVGIHFF